MKRLVCALLLSSLPAMAGCSGGDPVGPFTSGEMILSFSIAPEDIEGGVIDRDISVATAAANLWISYVRLVTDLCGNEPASFDVHSIAVTLDFEASEEVSQLEQVLDGQVTVYFTQGGTTVDIGTGVLLGAGPVGLQGLSSQASLATLYTEMLAGTFNVGLRGGTSRTTNDDFAMQIQISFLTRATCQ